jgi:effector-binding domain-containing protein
MGEKNMFYSCELKELPVQPTISVRKSIPVQELKPFLDTSYGLVYQHLCAQGEPPAGPPYAAYYNMDMQNLDVEAGFPVSKSLTGEGEMKASEMLSGKFAACLHIGSYDELAPAYQALTQWTQENGYETTGVKYEVYLNDPALTPPEELRTQILFQLKDA